MRKILIITVFMTVFTACNKLDEFTTFKMIYHSEATIPATIGINVPLDIPMPPVTTSSEQVFENNNTHKDLVEEIFLDELKIKITDPTNGDFSFLKDIELYLSADGLPDIKIAWLYNIPNNVGNELNLATTGSDLKAYITRDEFNLKLKVTTDELITRDYTVDVKTVFEVNAKILGI